MERGIAFDKSLCSRCGLCAEVCPNKIPRKAESGDMAVREDRAGSCFVCGQCMAVCPASAISVPGLSYGKDFFELSTALPPEGVFLELIKTRRAVRNFADAPVPREKLEKIVEAMTYAPPSFPPMKTGGKKRFATMESHLMPLLKLRLPYLRDGSEDTITRGAPAMILLHAPEAGEDIRFDVDIASTYAVLAAHSLGLGGSIMDIIPPAINHSVALRKSFGVPEGHEVLSTVIVGIPRYRYRRGIARQHKSVAWA